MAAENRQDRAIVTGGSGGIGRAICIELARSGAYVVVNYLRNQEAAEKTLSQVTEAGGQGEILRFDVCDRLAAEEAVQQVSDRLGGIDILVNNAGAIADGLFMMMSPENWHKVIETSLYGFYNMTRPVIERMVRQQRREGKTADAHGHGECQHPGHGNGNRLLRRQLVNGSQAGGFSVDLCCQYRFRLHA